MTVELFAVQGRRRADPIAVSNCRDFRLLKAAGDVEGDGDWTPYCLDEKTGRIALVECPRDLDLTAAPFYYQAQYQHARRLMLLGADDFVGLAHRRLSLRESSVFPAGEEEMPLLSRSERRRCVMIYSTGRAGTTLVSKMFARLPSCVSLSEPDFETSLQVAGGIVPRVTDVLRAAADCYFQAGTMCLGRPAACPTHLVLKFRGMCVELAESMRAAHPGVVEFFLYRDAEAYVVSSMRAFSYVGSPLWQMRWAHGLVVTRPLLMRGLRTNYEVMCRCFPLMAQYTPQELSRLGPVGLLTISWLSMMARAHALALPSLRYETLMRDPPAVLERLLGLCGLACSDVGAALGALDHDSQQGSVLGRKRVSHYQLSLRDRAIMREVLASHPVIQQGDFALGNAIA